ncbi:MAG TPA: hypothetical protein VLE99_02065 [Candidatus Saccharimonadales bacterium]|nr:hypothetical protein [Candidatus Saccharimonadales bacterium]
MATNFNEARTVTATIQPDGPNCNAVVDIQPPIGDDLMHVARRIGLTILNEGPPPYEASAAHTGGNTYLEIGGLHQHCNDDRRTRPGNNHDEHLNGVVVGAFTKALRTMGMLVNEPK